MRSGLLTAWTLIVWAALAAQPAAGAPSGGNDAVEASPAASHPGPETQPTSEALAARFPQAPPGARFDVQHDGWFAPTKPNPKLAKLPPAVTKAFILPVREEINEKTFESLKRRLDIARKAGAQLVIIDMDTWGGMVMAALDITRMLKTQVPDAWVVCFVRTRAVSAGSMIAVACDEIVMTPIGTLGDSAPISMAGSIEGVEREKIETVLRNEFAESCEAHGYPPALGKAMVSMNLEALLVRNTKTKELRYVLRNEFANELKESSDSGLGIGWKPDWEIVKIIDSDNHLLTLKSNDAKEYGFASQLIESSPADPFAGVLKRFNVTAQPTVLEDTWSETLTDFLSSPIVTGALFFVAVFFGYTALHSHGFGLSAIVTICAIALMFGSRYLIGMAAWWEIAAFIIGVILLMLELFVIPGFGVAGVLGGLLMAVGLLAMLVANPPDKVPLPQTDMDWSILHRSLLWLGAGLVGSVGSAAVLSRFLPKIPIAGAVVLAEVKQADVTPEISPEVQRVQVGQEGATETLCRPSGKVRIGGELYDALCEGDIIDGGQKVRVVGRSGNSLLIERVHG